MLNHNAEEIEPEIVSNAEEKDVVSFDNLIIYSSCLWHSMFIILFRSKVRVIQNLSKFFFSFIYIWFDRAWRADHEYMVFISIRLLFGQKNAEKLECLKMSFWETKI